MTADVLAMQGASTSAARVLTYLSGLWWSQPEKGWLTDGTAGCLLGGEVGDVGDVGLLLLLPLDNRRRLRTMVELGVCITASIKLELS